MLLTFRIASCNLTPPRLSGPTRRDVPDFAIPVSRYGPQSGYIVDGDSSFLLLTLTDALKHKIWLNALRTTTSVPVRPRLRAPSKLNRYTRSICCFYTQSIEVLLNPFLGLYSGNARYHDNRKNNPNKTGCCRFDGKDNEILLF